MKTLENIAKALESGKIDLAAVIGDNENVSIEDLTANEKFSVAVFAELKKAIDTKDSVLSLDADYPQSKFHDTDQYKVDYYRLVSNDTKNQSMIQFYVSANLAKRTCHFRLCTSCAKMNRAQFEALESELQFTVKYNKDRTRAKTSERTKVQYAELPEVVKAVCAVLANSAKAAQPSDDPSDSAEE